MKCLQTLICYICFFSSLSAWALGDSVRMESRIDEVYSQYGLTGQGTVVAIIDRGIDYTHPDFIKNNGETRIAYIYDMLDPAGANDPDNNWGIGTIYDMAEINQALMSGNMLATNDRHGHGTASAGISAGNGSAIASNKYQGVAYEATIIVVKAFQDGFPPFGSQAGQTGFFDPSYLPIALEFVSEKVAELGLPSVTLMNLGSIGGATDGTSSICQAMDAFTGPGKLLVCGVGDDGGGDNHASGTLTMGGSIDLEIHKGTVGNLRFDLWYPDSDRFDISIENPAGTIFGPFSSPATNAINDDQFLTGINYYHRGSDVDFSQASSPTRELLIDFTGDTGVYVVQLIGSQVSDGNFHASLNPATYYNNNDFLSPITPGYSINDYASAFNVITPTDYVTRKNWIDINGINRSRTGEGAVGDLWVGSSVGPTYDERLGVDIAAPGEVLFTSYTADTWYSNAHWNVIQDGQGYYGLQNAVSAASPLVTGVLALMLELDPDMTVEEAKDFLHNSARTDAFTGTTPNAAWGYGKLDALMAVELVSQSLPIEGSLNPAAQMDLYPNPALDQLTFRFDDGLNVPVEFQLFNIHGQLLRTAHFHSAHGKLKTDGLGTGLYFLQITRKGIYWTEKFRVQ